MLRNPLGRHRFRAYLLGYGKEEVLDLWWDAELCEQISRMVRGGATAIQDVYFDSTEGALDRLVPGASAQLVQARALDASFSTLSRAVLRGMYDTHFRAFVKRKLVEQSQVRLGGTGVEREGLGEIWCITNPRLVRPLTSSYAGPYTPRSGVADASIALSAGQRDNPIVLVSDAFCAMFGSVARAPPPSSERPELTVNLRRYTAASILGRNCRFLQGVSCLRRSPRLLPSTNR